VRLTTTETLTSIFEVAELYYNCSSSAGLPKGDSILIALNPIWLSPAPKPQGTNALFRNRTNIKTSVSKNRHADYAFAILTKNSVSILAADTGLASIGSSKVTE
jgi:hypothetical protein